MTLFRQTIRDDAVARLIAAETDAGDHVLATRIDPVPFDELPVLKVYTVSESGENLGASDALQFRIVLDLVVEAVVERHGEEPVEDALDRLCEQVETALLLSAAWRDQFEFVERYDTEIEMRRDGERALLAATMSFGLVARIDYLPGA